MGKKQPTCSCAVVRVNGTSWIEQFVGYNRLKSLDKLLHFFRYQTSSLQRIPRDEALPMQMSVFKTAHLQIVRPCKVGHHLQWHNEMLARGENNISDKSKDPI